mgnify:FL=1
MDNTQLKRHNLVFLTEAGRKSVLQRVTQQIKNKEALKAAEEIFCAAVEVPGIIRRDDDSTDCGIAIGFVHYCRMDGNRLRIATYAKTEEIKKIVSVYALTACHNQKRTECMRIIDAITELATDNNLKIGILGSAGMELVTGMPYTDECSDIDILLKPAPYNVLQQFYSKVKSLSNQINMDFELELPNGYGVKLAELFMNTSTVLGKSIKDVDLLNKKEIMQMLEREK